MSGMILAGYVDGDLVAVESVDLTLTGGGTGLRVGASPCGDGPQLLIRKRGMCHYARTVEDCTAFLGVADLSGFTVVRRWA